jgi:hypothetical protein
MGNTESSVVEGFAPSSWLYSTHHLLRKRDKTGIVCILLSVNEFFIVVRIA